MATGSFDVVPSILLTLRTRSSYDDLHTGDLKADQASSWTSGLLLELTFFSDCAPLRDLAV